MIKLAQSIIHEFTRNLAMAPIDFEGDGFCHLLVNDQLMINLKCDEENQRLTLIAEIKASLPESLSQAQVHTLLSHSLTMMHSHGPSLGWDAELGLIGFTHLPMSTLSLANFEITLADFLDWLNANPITLEPTYTPANEHLLMQQNLKV